MCNNLQFPYMCAQIPLGAEIWAFRAKVGDYWNFDLRTSLDRHPCVPKLPARLPVCVIGGFCLLQTKYAWVPHLCATCATQKIYLGGSLELFFSFEKRQLQLKLRTDFDSKNICDFECLPVIMQEPMSSLNPYKWHHTCIGARRVRDVS